MKAMVQTTLLMMIGLAASAATAADGQELFAEFCQSCHEPDATVLKEFQGSKERFTEILEGDTQDMPDFFGFFEEDEIEALYQYIYN